MSITKTVVKRPTTIFIIFAILIGLGVYSGSDLAIDLYPEIEPPVLLVFTDYAGAGPEEVEKSITRPLEGVLSNVSNIEDINSTSSEGSSQVTVEFAYGTNMAEAANEIRDKLEYIKPYLPQEAESPMIFKFDPSMIPVMGLVVEGNRTPEELRQISEDIVQPRLEQVEGVALTSVTGGREQVVRVEIPQNRLAAYNLPLTQVANMLRGQNVQISAGSITEGNKNYLIRTSGEYQSIDQIKDTVIAYKATGTQSGTAGAMGGSASAMGPSGTGQTVVRLRDIANVFESYREQQSSVFINGKPGVYVTLQKQSGTNSVQTAENVRARMDQINNEVPVGIQIKEIFNTTDIIKTSIAQVSSSAIYGALFAVIVLFIFLRSLKSTFIIGLTIPVSIVITLMLMYFAGLTLNIMTLAGLALGVGMLVDNSIVILENIFRYREKGTKLTASAILGSQEMINAIVASTLTTISVFAPVALFKGQLEFIGEMFAGLAFTVVISLASSLFVAMLLIPVLASHFFPIRSRRQRPLRGLMKVLDNLMAGLFYRLDNGYKKILAGILRFRWITVGIVVAAFMSSLLLIPQIGFVFLPTMEQDSVEVSVEMPLGTKLEVTETVLKQLETIIKDEVEGYTDIIVEAGQRGFFGFLGSIQAHKGNLRVLLPEYDERIDSSEEVKRKLRSHFNEFPSANFSFSSGGGGGFMGGASPIDVMVKTEDLEKGRDIAYRIRDLISDNVPRVTEPTVDFKEGVPQIEIFVDRDKAYSLGLNINNIGREIQANIDGITASKFRKGGSEYDILVILEEEDRNELPDLQQIFVQNATGQKIALSNFARLERTTGPISISRENQSRVIHVTGGLKPGVPVNEVELQIRDLISREIPADEEVVIEFSGDYADLLKYGTKFGIIFLISIFLVFGVMAAQFESFLDPFIILFTMPLTIIGVLLIHWFTGEILSIFTAVGMVILIGIVVNNGIVLVDYINLLRKRGMSIREAIIEGGGNRLRPILMTTLTTVLALIPLGFFEGEGADLVKPIGQSVVGGLSVSTLLTLFLIPVLYSLFNNFTSKRAQKKEAKKEKRRQLRREAAQTNAGQTGSIDQGGAQS
ncbi:MAG: efflux RND transporter permease subunit [Spirochaetales bacterium]|nr:efflux RND transporter permease subunit [Spirochaetales bacterium]MCF7937979.1 efflux RND transporter permease subunit [Spirochaetales bacterium]